MVSLPILKVSMPQVLRIGCLAAVAFGAVLAAEGQIPSQKGPPPTAPPTAATQPPLGTWAIRESCKGTDCNVVFTAELFLERYSTADQIATLADAAADGRCAEVVKTFPSLGGLMSGIAMNGQFLGTALVPGFATARLLGGLWRISVTAGGSALRDARPDTPLLLELSLDRSGKSGTGRLYMGTTISCVKGTIAAQKPLDKPVAVTVRRKD